MVILSICAFVAILTLLRILEPSPLSDWTLLRDMLLDQGMAGPVIFVFLVAVIPLVAPLSLLIITGAAAFGPLYGMILSYIGALLNANLTFFLVKKIRVEDLWENAEKTARIKEAICRRGFHFVLGLQMLSVIPFVAINSAAAASGIRWKDFFTATLMGIIPAIVINSLVGETVVANLLPPDIYFAFILLVFLVIIIAGLRNRHIRIGRKGAQ